MNTNQIVASKVKETRTQKGYSAEFMATKLKISKGAYSQLENGKTEITFSRIEAISTILETPLSDFIPNTKGNVIINNDQSTGFIGNQINHNTDEAFIKQMKEVIETLQLLLSKIR